jgi:dTDP-4-dehydrorhamnose reductase
VSIPRPRKVLITGGTGLVGEGLRAIAPADWSIVATHRRPYEDHDPATRVADIRDRGAMERLFAEHAFDAVVHTAGIASVDESEQHVDESTASNLGGTRNIAELCAKSGARLIYLSTNAVFDGTRAPYRETDPVCPVNAYGRIKVACEQVVASTVPGSVIVRPILMYGWPHPKGRPNPVTWIVAALRRGEAINVVDDVFENPLHNIAAADAIWRILNREVTGIIHLAGRDTLNRYELALLVARVFGLDASRIQRVSSAYFAHLAPRPPNTTLATDRMEHDLGLPATSLEDGLRAMATKAPHVP